MNRRLLVSVLAMATLFLGWKTYRAWTEDVAAGVSPPVAQAVQSPAAALDSAAPGPDTSAAVATIMARPVFRADRKPFRPDDPAAAGPARNYDAELSRYMLLGVVIQADTRKAVVVTRGSAKPERWEVGAGDTIPGFAVKDIEQDGVTLSADGKEFLLPLFAGGPKASAQGPPRTEGRRMPTTAPGPASAPPRVAPGARPPQPIVAPPGVAGQTMPPINMPGR